MPVRATAAPIPTDAEYAYDYVRPYMYPKQEAAIFEPRRWAFIEASTKAGKTVGCIVWLAELAMNGKAGRNYWWVAPVYSQAKIAFNRMKRRLPADMIETNQTDMTIHLLPTDTWIWFKTAERPDALYGEDVYGVVIDEASRVREESWFAIRSTLTATKAPARVIGNVKGRKTWFFKLARRAEKGEDENAAFHKITAWDAVEAGVLDKSEIDDARTQLPDAVFRELYEADASDDEGNPFGYKYIQECAWDGIELSGEPIVCWGVDLARKRDWTVGCGLDRFGQLAGFFRFQKPWPEQIEFIRKTCGGVPTYVDASGLGDVVLGLVQQPLSGDTDGYKEELKDYVLYTEDIRRRVMAGELDEESLDDIKPFRPSGEVALGREFGDTMIEGFVYNQKTKQMLMEGLAVTIQSHQIGYPAEIEPGTDHPVKLELESFEYVYTRIGVRYSAPEGEHDDCVNSLALAAKCMQDKILYGMAAIDMGSAVSSLEHPSTWDFGANHAEKMEREREFAQVTGGSSEGDTSGGEWNFGW